MDICFEILSLNVAGGAEKVLSELASNLTQRGHSVTVICLSREGKSTFYPLSPAVKIRYIDGWDNYIPLGKIRPVYIFHRITLLYRLLKDIKPDVSVSFLTDITIYAAWASKFARVPHVSCERSSPWDKPESRSKRQRRDRAFAASWGCVFQTEAAQSYFGETIRRRWVVIPNPISLTCQTDGGPVVRRKNIVSVGRLVPQKNHILLLRGFYEFHNKHPQYTLELYGRDGGCLSELNCYIQEKQLQDAVTIHDPVRDIHERIRDASMFVLTSEYEGFPNALAEAVSLGIPSISTDCRSKGPAYILGNGSRGILIPHNDINALVKAMEKLAFDDAEAEKLVAEGRKLRGLLHVERYIDCWEKYLFELER